MITVQAHELLKRVSEQGADSAAVAALDLHLRALIAARDGDLQRASALFAEAQQWESANGYGKGALHTSHQMALLSNFGGDLAKLRSYYEETLRTLKRTHNREGAALCLRSLGEVALVDGRPAEVERAWKLSEHLFDLHRLPESKQVSAWRGCLRSFGM